MINKIASDLGIYRFDEEQSLQYHCRVIYSAIACWIKAIALDKPIGYEKLELLGVSRRHIFERSNAILETMIKMFPETQEWFDLSDENENAATLIRSRLINHGDLLNEGFNTNLALSAVRFEQLSSMIECVYGTIIDDGQKYSGISSIRLNNHDSYQIEPEDVKEWFQDFIKDVWWAHNLPNASLLQYYNPHSKVKNNYSAWQDSMPDSVNDVVLARTIINKINYEYYLLKPKEKLAHKLDSFLQEQGFQIRIMCALRSLSDNKTTAKVIRYNHHVQIKLNAYLPLKESLLLESYAWPLKKINDRLEWVMEPMMWDYIRTFVEALDIQITEELHG